MFCLVVITYASPNVSVTASKRTPRKKEGPWGFKFEICIKSTQHFLELDWLAILEYICMYIFFCFDILHFFCFFFLCAKIGYGADCWRD